MFDMNPVQEKMNRAIDAFKKEIAKQRAGRANPALISGLMVATYGTEQPLSQVASVTSESATVLAVKPWDKKLIPAIERAIHGSDLGLNPLTAGDIVRVPFPPLTEERRKEIVKLVKQTAEQAKVAIRNIRRDANQDVKDQEKAKILPEDQSKKFQEKIQKLTDDSIVQVDTLVSEKEAELMKV
ncbi:MAG: ribosome recycling factor [Gammaproteobacteria bacterium]|nr:ribosome recycling factor [Gammaproteobacteria bacterium]